MCSAARAGFGVPMSSVAADCEVRSREIGDHEPQERAESRYWASDAKKRRG